VFAKWLKCQKKTKKLKKAHLWLNLLVKCFSFAHNFFDWYEIWTTQLRLVCITFLKNKLEMDIVWRWNKMSKFTIIKKCLDFELWIVPKHSKQHENFTTISRFQGNITQQILWKRTLDEGDTSPQSCNHHNVVWRTQIKLVNFKWLLKN